MMVATTERTRTIPRTTPRPKTREADRGDEFEYFLDRDARREDTNGFHLLLLGQTFMKPRMTVPYAAGALSMVLEMDDTTATERASFANEHGMSCLGNWQRDEALNNAKQLSARDLSVRVVPGVKGKQDWQGSPANANPDGLPTSV
ncbi:hypothetical protein CTAYLR_008735 [Chrysophaeum taylorii]|uniref:Uncharacterized protein n=1 Tax=Chrysophaeum taylorii TaxID=2483200 RepID=A0AAD7XLT8_9STRA|nr:hypothetical protein CTAYLR_008735 [Chrysophaeum taylorii]